MCLNENMKNKCRLLSKFDAKDEADPFDEGKEFQILKASQDSQQKGPGQKFYFSSTGPLKLYLPEQRCDPALKTMLECLPRRYDLIFSDNNDRVRIVVDLKDVPKKQVTEMIAADMRRAFENVQSPFIASQTTERTANAQTNPILKGMERLARSGFSSWWVRHPLADFVWYKELKNAVFSEVTNCYRKSERTGYTGLVLVFITPNVQRQYTNQELPGLSMDLHRAYQEGCTPFYEDGKEVIPYKYTDFRRCGIEDLYKNLKDISNAKKAAAIVSCSEEDWTSADVIAKEWNATWLAKRKTDQTI